MLSLVPSRTALVIKTDNLKEFATNLTQNTFIANNTTLPLITAITKHHQPLRQLQISNSVLLCYTRIDRNNIGLTLITKSTPNLLDSVQTKKTDTYSYNNHKIVVYSFNDNAIYGTKLNGFYVFGNSKLVIENMSRLANTTIQPNKDLLEIAKSTSSDGPNLFINQAQFQKLYANFLPNGRTELFKNLTNWTALDLKITPKGFSINGATTPNKDEILGLFKGTLPYKNEIAKITPVSALGFYSFTYNDYDQLKKNISFYRKQDYPKLALNLLSSAKEVAEIHSKDYTALAIRISSASKNASQPLNSEDLIETHRNHEIYAFSHPQYFKKALAPLTTLDQLHYYTKINSFYLFAKDVTTLEEIIANVQNSTVLSKQKPYQNTTNKMAQKSSILTVGITRNTLRYIANNTASKYKKDYLNTAINHYTYGVLQFVNHDNYTYVNGLFQESTKRETPRGGIQTESIKIGEDIAAGPWYFINWKTNHYDIVVQGESDTLYSFNENGKLRWKTSLEGTIIGDIQEIDLFQNHRIQIAFTTPNKLYIVARNGKIVAPFNKTFKKPITQPLALFDYYHNGRFRFLITQGNRVTMFDKHLDIVKGFEFTKANSTITEVPRHFRIDSKDYIIIPEKSGQLHILNPRGQTRIKVKEEIHFSSNPWFYYKGQFTSTNAAGQLVQINREGQLTTTDLHLKEDHMIDATSKSLVTFSGNTLTIKGKPIPLDYGIYTRPKIFYINDTLYFSITDKQAHKVYLFDSSAQPFPGFPVYGNSAIALKNMDDHGSLELLVKGENNSILVYEIH